MYRSKKKEHGLFTITLLLENEKCRNGSKFEDVPVAYGRVTGFTALERISSSRINDCGVSI